MRRLVPALLALIVCAACTPPIYDPSASLAATTLDRIPTLLDTGYLDNLPNEFDFREDSYTFLPELSGATPKTLTDSSGFVIRTRNGWWNRVCYVWENGGPEWILGNTEEYSSDDPMLPRWVVSLKDGAYLGFVSLDSSTGRASVLFANTTYPRIEVSSTDIAAAVASSITGLSLPSTPQVVGASVNADSNPTADKFRVLVREGSSFSEAVANVNSGGFVGSFSEAFPGLKRYDLSTFLGTPWHLRYFHDGLNGRSFAQSYDPVKKTWATWAWGNPPATSYARLPEITHRIDAALSSAVGDAANSYLFSTEDQIGRVYAYDGAAARLVAEFPLGSLRFIGEAFVYSEWRMLFSRCLLDTAKRQLRFQIRSILTAEVLTTFGS